MGWIDDLIDDTVDRAKDPIGAIKPRRTARTLGLGFAKDPYETSDTQLEGIGLAVDDPEGREVDPQAELDELNRAYRAYTTSSMYEGEIPLWVQSDFGNVPVGGYTAEAPELEKDRMSSLWMDYAAARSQLRDRITAQPKYDGGFSPDFGPKTFMPDSDMSEQEIADLVGSYLYGTADYGVQDPVVGTPTPGQPGDPSAPPAPSRSGSDRFTPVGNNPFAQRARDLGFTEYQNLDPSNEQSALAGALRQGSSEAFGAGDGGMYRGGGGRASGPMISQPPTMGPTQITPTRLVGMPGKLENPGTLTQAMQAAALRGDGGQNGR